MAFKVVILLVAASCAHAAVIGAPAVVAPGYGYGGLAGYGHYGAVAKLAVPAVAKVAVADYDPNPQYSYSYDIHDAITGDNKGQQETRSGDVVQGSYTLIEPDGNRRTVEYTADPVNGFNAVVHREPAVIAKAVVPAVAKAVVASPYGFGAPAYAAHGYAAPAYAAHGYAAPAYAAPAYAAHGYGGIHLG